MLTNDDKEFVSARIIGWNTYHHGATLIATHGYHCNLWKVLLEGVKN